MLYFRRFILLLWLSAPAFSYAAEALTVAVAANVKFAFNDLALAFTQSTGIDVESIFTSSGKIVSQVKEGAPYDVFLSADMDYPGRLYQDGQAVAAPKVYAYGKLVIWAKNDIFKGSKGLVALTDAAVNKVAIANPKLAPYGEQAVNAIEKSGFKNSITPKLVFADNIAQVVQYVQSGHVEAGITAKSVVSAPEIAGKGQWVDMPTNLYQPIAQGAVILRYGNKHHAEAARKFYVFLYSPAAREILEKYDYALP